MRGIGRILMIVAILVIGLGVAGYFLAPSRAIEKSFAVDRPVEQVYTWLAAAPANTEVAEGLTISGVTSADAANHVVTANVNFAGVGEGTARFTVSPGEAGKSNVAVLFDQDLGPNPIDRYMSFLNNPLAPTADAAATALDARLDNLNANPISGLAYEIVDVAPKSFIYTGGPDQCAPITPAEIKRAVAEILPHVRLAMSQNRLPQSGLPLAVELSWDQPPHPGEYCFQIGYPFAGEPPAQRIYGGGVTIGTTPSGRAMRVHFEGTEESVIPVYDQMEALAEAGHLRLGRSFEVYYDNPNATTGSVNRDIYYLIEAGDTARLRELAPSAGPVPPQETLVLTPTAAEAASPAEGATPAAEGAAPAATPPAETPTQAKQ